MFFSDSKGSNERLELSVSVPVITFETEFQLFRDESYKNLFSSSPFSQHIKSKSPIFFCTKKSHFFYDNCLYVFIELTKLYKHNQPFETLCTKREAGAFHRWEYTCMYEQNIKLSLGFISQFHIFSFLPEFLEERVGERQGDMVYTSALTRILKY